MSFLILALHLSQFAAAHASDPAVIITNAHPEARPFKSKALAMAEVDAALMRARSSDKMALVVFGANWCHDSRALAGWFETPRFAAMLQSRYELVYVDVGMRDRNLDVAKRLGIQAIKGTPTVAILSSQGKLLNKKDAKTWRNAASRNEERVYRHFAEFTAP